MITEEKINSFAYFYNEKSLDSWSIWDSVKQEFFDEYPELEMLLKQQEATNKALDRVVRGIVDEYFNE